jgi:hypothetical protein
MCVICWLVKYLNERNEFKKISFCETYYEEIHLFWLCFFLRECVNPFLFFLKKIDLQKRLKK